MEDIERLREHLGIERWIVSGLSWGVSLGLVYAQAFPARVQAMALGAITGGTRVEIEWITRAMGRVFPREWEEFVAPLPVDERDGNLPAAYARLLADPDPVVRENAALQWCRWEDVHVSLMPGWTPSVRYQNPDFRRVMTRLVTHYWGNDCFLAPNQILDGMDRLAEIPAILVHGRYDISGPLDTAWAIHRRWPGSELVGTRRRRAWRQRIQRGNRGSAEFTGSFGLIECPGAGRSERAGSSTIGNRLVDG